MEVCPPLPASFVLLRSALASDSRRRMPGHPQVSWLLFPYCGLAFLLKFATSFAPAFRVGFSLRSIFVELCAFRTLDTSCSSCLPLLVDFIYYLSLFESLLPCLLAICALRRAFPRRLAQDCPSSLLPDLSLALSSPKAKNRSRTLNSSVALSPHNHNVVSVGCCFLPSMFLFADCSCSVSLFASYLPALLSFLCYELISCSALCLVPTPFALAASTVAPSCFWTVIAISIVP